MKLLRRSHPFATHATTSTAKASSMTFTPIRAVLKPTTQAIALLCIAGSSALAQSNTNNLNSDNSRLPRNSSLEQARFGAALAQVGSIEIRSDRNVAPANGKDAIVLTIRVLDRGGNPVVGDVPVVLQTTRGRFVSVESIDSFASAADREFAMPGNQLLAKNGELKVKLQAPGEPGEALVQVNAGQRQGSINVSFTPDLREMIAAGLVEGVINVSRRRGNIIQPTRASDGFEQELRNFSRQFQDGKGAMAARTAFFLKGRVKGETLLTAAYDSDKEVRDRLFRDIRPEEFYPVYGDSSVVGFDAQSGSRLYVRLDNDKNFLLWGDFTTADSLVTNEASQLGRYSRALTGLQGQWSVGGEKKDALSLKAFASQDTLRQVADELPARGISGPYTLRFSNGVTGSERVEILVRDRNAPTIVLQSTPLVRFVDYDFEPFSGRLLFKAPIQSLDANLNPVSIRVLYEVEDSGEKYWVYGVDATAKLGEPFSVGGTYAKDQNSLATYELGSVNATAKIGASTRAIAEYAQSKGGAVSNYGFTPANASLPIAVTEAAATGKAARAELRHDGSQLQARVYGQRMGAGFNNIATSSLASGSARTEAGAKATYAITDKFRLTGEALGSKDDLTQGTRNGAFGGVAWDFLPQLTGELGLRHAEQKGAGATIPATGAAGSLPGTSLSTVSGGSIVDPTAAITTANQPYSSNSVKGKLIWRMTPSASVFVEGEQAVSDNAQGNKGHAVAIGGEYRFSDLGRLYARSEHATGLGGDYGLSGTGTQAATVIGLDTQYMKDGQLFSEYRLRDAIGGRQAVAAAGLRNVWRVAPGWRLNTAVERVKVFDGIAQEGKAIALGLDYLGSQLWKASTRLEWREDGFNNTLPGSLAGKTTSWLHSLAVARKLSEDWTLLGRNLFLHKDNPGVLGATTENRFQVGAAWRETQTNVWNALARYEYRLRDDPVSGEDSRKHILSLDATYHPSRPWWIYSKLAGKLVDANIACITDPLTGSSSECVRSQGNTQLIQGRVIYDITPRWDIGMQLSVLGESGFKNRNYGYGAELGYLIAENLWVSAGFNFKGITDKDLATDYTAKGAFLKLRFKFDEKIFKRSEPVLDTSVVPPAK
jgi:hypothetical protein